jgi:hypothetical protein
MHWGSRIGRVIQAQEQVNVVMLVAFDFGCDKVQDVFEITVFYFFINF